MGIMSKVGKRVILQLLLVGAMALTGCVLTNIHPAGSVSESNIEFSQRNGTVHNSLQVEDEEATIKFNISGHADKGVMEVRLLKGSMEMLALKGDRFSMEEEWTLKKGFYTIEIIYDNVYDGSLTIRLASKDHFNYVREEEKEDNAKAVYARGLEEDYFQAVDWMSKYYIYFEEHMGMKREDFHQAQVEATRHTRWEEGDAVFVEEIRRLLAQFPDGSLEWSMEQIQWPIQVKSLGFVANITTDKKVRVEKVYESFETQLEEGDQIIQWNGQPVEEVIQEHGQLFPQSTQIATQAYAIQRLSFEPSVAPRVSLWVRSS